MQLRVYQENALAINFYLKNGFVLKDELRDEQTGKAEYLMEWKKKLSMLLKEE